MNTWTPLWSQIVDSTLWEEPPEVRVLFVTMLALKDADDICQSDAYHLHKRANLPEETVVKALAILEAPDTRRKFSTQKFEGRRIEAVEGGWKILNGAKYRSLILKMRRREYQANWAAEKRASQAEAARMAGGAPAEVVLTGQDALAHQAAAGKSHAKRRKVVEQAGTKAGAVQAIAEGFAGQNGQVATPEPVANDFCGTMEENDEQSKLRVRSAASGVGEVLPGVPREIHSGVAQDPPIEGRSNSQGQGASSGGLSLATGQAGASALPLRESQERDAPRGLQPAVARDVAVPGASPGPAPEPAFPVIKRYGKDV